MQHSSCSWVLYYSMMMHEVLLHLTRFFRHAMRLYVLLNFFFFDSAFYYCYFVGGSDDWPWS
jgi:hypothetical protein